MSPAAIRAGLDVETALAADVVRGRGRDGAAGENPDQAAFTGPDADGPRVLVAGMDEVGRGALAGPVVVGVSAVWLPRGAPIPPVRDSKALTDRRRRALVPQILLWADAAGLGEASPAEIDRLGITGALALAARRAWAAVCEAAGEAPAALILDGGDDWLSRAARGGSAAELPGPVPPAPHLLVRAEDRCATVAAASILAKVGRDDQMIALHADHPAYGWAGNKGYGAQVHRDALRERGATDHHRRSWNLGIPGESAGAGRPGAAGRAACDAPDDAAPTLFD